MMLDIGTSVLSEFCTETGYSIFSCFNARIIWGLFTPPKCAQENKGTTFTLSKIGTGKEVYQETYDTRKNRECHYL